VRVRVCVCVCVCVYLYSCIEYIISFSINPGLSLSVTGTTQPEQQ